MKRASLLAVLWFALVLTASAQEPVIRVEAAWVRPSPVEAGAWAAYMVLRNDGAAPDALVGAASEVAGMVEPPETVKAGDMMHMRPVPRLEVPARGQVELKPGGFHLMLMHMKGELPIGQRIRIILKFEKRGEIPVEAEVRKQ
jgi:copper(I)-binding protein